MNTEVGGINGPSSPAGKEPDEVQRRIARKLMTSVPFLCKVSRMFISTSVLPTPGPPRRARVGRMRFWRVSIPAETESAPLLESPSGVGVSWGDVSFSTAVPFLSGLFPRAFDEGLDW